MQLMYDFYCQLEMDLYLLNICYLLGTIPVLRKSSLFRLAKQLNEDECYKLAVQLNISERKLSTIESKLEFKTAMFKIWRPLRPNETLVFNLVKALKTIDKCNEADAVQGAFAENVEFKPELLDR